MYKLNKGRPEPVGENRPKILVVFFTIALVTLACAVGGKGSSDPLFTPPGSGLVWTPTPDSASIADPQQNPTDVPAAAAIPSPTPLVTPDPVDLNTTPILYYAQSGDTLSAVAARFNVTTTEITSPASIPPASFISPNQLLIIPHRLANTTSDQKLLPDSEVVYSPTASDFDINAFVKKAGGYLSKYQEWLGSTEWTNGADIVLRVARENSINPRLLLAILEYQSGWVYGQPGNLAIAEYPLGKIDPAQHGLYLQLAWAVDQLSIGFYGWRSGSLVQIQFSDGAAARLAPSLNAGTVALQYYFAQVYDSQGWVSALDPNQGVPALYEKMFGSPWLRALQVEPLFPPELTQPTLILPFFIGQMWSFTGGPHGAWEHDGSLAALDFAPNGESSGCVDTNAWALAMAPGLIVRTDKGVVVEDLDGDGNEETGWAILYLHIATVGKIAVGTWVQTGDLIGKPSCEGGYATGTHVHIARKYNGEWIDAAGPLPFVLSGWTAHAGSAPYLGYLTRDGQTITASIYGEGKSHILRLRSDP